MDPCTTLQYPVELHSAMKVKQLVSERGMNGFRHQKESTNFFDATNSFIFPILLFEKSTRVISMTVQIPSTIRIQYNSKIWIIELRIEVMINI